MSNQSCYTNNKENISYFDTAQGTNKASWAVNTSIKPHNTTQIIFTKIKLVKWPTIVALERQKSRVSPDFLGLFSISHKINYE